LAWRAARRWTGIKIIWWRAMGKLFKTRLNVKATAMVDGKLKTDLVTADLQ
jgi:hypothetical protein